MFHLVLKSCPLHVENGYYFASTSQTLSWICNPHRRNFAILAQIFASPHYFIVQYADLEMHMDLNDYLKLKVTDSCILTSAI